MRVKERGKRKGFTLVELAIVLVIIGLLMGMVLKGSQLITSAKEKRFAQALQKFTSAIGAFMGAYDRLPGDGCLNPNARTVDGICERNELATACLNGFLERSGTCANEFNGNYFTGGSAGMFFKELVNSGIMSVSDMKEPITSKGWGPGDLQGRIPGIWIETADAENRGVVCAADQLIDDGESESGNIRAENGQNYYDRTTDCRTLLRYSIEGNYRIWQ